MVASPVANAAKGSVAASGGDPQAVSSGSGSTPLFDDSSLATVGGSSTSISLLRLKCIGIAVTFVFLVFSYCYWSSAAL